MRDLLTDPCWTPEDLGHPLPDSPFAVSVSLPHWQHVIGYEECDPAILDQLRAGYPRFFAPRPVRSLELSLQADFGQPGELCAIYPTPRAAERCQAYVKERADGWQIRIREVPGGIFAVFFPEEVASIAADYWRYCGEGISGRHAEAIAAEAPSQPAVGETARAELKARIASQTGQGAEDVFLFQSGMAAVSAVHRVVSSHAEGRRSVQFDFPYVDVLRVQREFGGGVVFLPAGDDEALAQLGGMITGGDLPSAVYCEVPSNPLLRSADLPGISALTSPAGVPLVVDDTVATNQNVDVFRYADVVTTSLTKYYSGVGDVLGGAVVVRRDSPLAAGLRAGLQAECEATLWDGDAVTLLANSCDYPERVQRTNETTLKLVDWLQADPRVAKVWYPTSETPENYEAVRRPSGGWSGLFSLLLNAPEQKTPGFYDALRICKGPSLGTGFSLACPYTLLAHYDELDWCEEMGVSRWLVRFSVGQEGPDELISRLDTALS